MNKAISQSVSQSVSKLSLVVSLLLGLAGTSQMHVAHAGDNAPTPAKVIKAQLLTQLGITQVLRLVGTNLNTVTTVELVINRQTSPGTIFGNTATDLYANLFSGVAVGKGVLRLVTSSGDVSEYAVEVERCVSVNDDRTCGSGPYPRLFNLIFYP
jgi:hypothetical protein